MSSQDGGDERNGLTNILTVQTPARQTKGEEAGKLTISYAIADGKPDRAQ